MIENTTKEKIRNWKYNHLVYKFKNFNKKILWNQDLHGCLNGVYSNDYLDGIIYNEIAKRHTVIGDDICGKYFCSYFDIDTPWNKAELSISIKHGKKNTYSFSWADENRKIVFEGVGYKMNEKQIAVHYWQK